MSAQIRADFDRLAQLEGDGWNHNSHYHPFLLRQAPRGGTALDIGCGTGEFSRLLAGRFDRVLGLDLAPEMIKAARARSGALPNLQYQVADVLVWDFPREEFDCISSIATLHHLPLEQMLQKAKAALKPGGVLLVLDLFKSTSFADRLADIASLPVGLVLRLVKTRRLREPEPVRRAWAAHGLHDVYLPLAFIRQVCARVLPGARIRRHLLWRYSIIWQKPAAPAG